MAPKIPLYQIVDMNAVFVIVDNNISNCNKSVLCAEEVLPTIAQNNKMISFTAVIKTKSFSDPLASRSNRDRKFNGYGTAGTEIKRTNEDQELTWNCITFAGPKTDVLHFFADISRTQSFTLYLNNWENMQTPCGLVPNSRVLVRNVMPQKGKYLKCCAVTSFTILSYEPLVEFETVNL